MKDGKFFTITIFLLLTALVLINMYDIQKLRKTNKALYSMIEWQDEVIAEISEERFYEDN